MRRFYFRSHDRVGDKVVLKGSEASHLSLVLRARVGQSVILFNERGEEFVASVAKIAPRQVELSIEEKKETRASPLINLHLGVALIKGKALEKVLSSATELGVEKIIIFRCERSVPRIRRSDVDKKLTRWRKVVLSGAKQCGRPVPPEIEYLFSWESLLERVEQYEKVFIALGSGRREPFSISHREKVLVIVGPEGGFTDEEKSAALDRGALPLSLGPFTLRSDTAAVAAVSLIINSLYHHLRVK